MQLRRAFIAMLVLSLAALLGCANAPDPPPEYPPLDAPPPEPVPDPVLSAPIETKPDAVAPDAVAPDAGQAPVTQPEETELPAQPEQPETIPPPGAP
jgi:hypothetical protein